MAGLLEGIGTVLAGGIAGAGKAVGETFAEQIKQQALAMREENMARISDLYATKRQEAGFAHEKNMAAAKASEEIFQGGIKQGYAQENAQLEAGLRLNEAEAKAASDKEIHGTYADKTAREATLYDQRTALEEKIYQRRQGESERDWQRRRVAEKEDAAILHKLKATDISPIEKTYDFMVKKLKVPEEVAKQAVFASLTAKDGATELDKRKLYATIYEKAIEAGKKEPDARKFAAEISSWSPEGAVARSAGGDFTLQGLISDLQKAGKSGPGNKPVERSINRVLPVHQPSVTPRESTPTPTGYSYEAEYEKKKALEYEANRPKNGLLGQQTY